MSLEIGGTCGNRIRIGRHEQFDERPSRRALTEKWLLVDGPRGDSEIVFNPTYFGGLSERKRRAILEHEIGHFLGLEAHTDEEGSIMRARPEYCAMTVTDADRADVARLY